MYKTCRICGEQKLLEDFYRAAGMADGYRSECKTCNLAQRSRRYRDEPSFRARDIARVKRWQQANAEPPQRDATAGSGEARVRPADAGGAPAAEVRDHAG
jgi:hypothetical protein